MFREKYCDEKSNEITAIPEFLDEINVEQSIVTINAMSTQTVIAEKIIAKKPITAFRSKAIKQAATTMCGCILGRKQSKILRKPLKKDMAALSGANIPLKQKSIGFTSASVGQAFGGASLKILRKLAGWDSAFQEKVLFEEAEM